MCQTSIRIRRIYLWLLYLCVETHLGRGCPDLMKWDVIRLVHEDKALVWMEQTEELSSPNSHEAVLLRVIAFTRPLSEEQRVGHCLV